MTSPVTSHLAVDLRQGRPAHTRLAEAEVDEQQPPRPRQLEVRGHRLPDVRACAIELHRATKTSGDAMGGDGTMSAHDMETASQSNIPRGERASRTKVIWAAKEVLPNVANLPCTPRRATDVWLRGDAECLSLPHRTLFRLLRAKSCPRIFSSCASRDLEVREHFSPRNISSCFFSAIYFVFLFK